LFEELFDSKGSGNAGDWGYPYQSYMDVYDFDVARKNNTSFKAKSQTQHDGKQNGIAIQAMQFGRKDILSLVGAMYSADKNVVVPFGDIRDRFLERMEAGTATAFATDEARLEYWNGFRNLLLSDKYKGSLKKFGKELSKTPLMETSYAKYEGFNEATAINFIDDNQEIFQQLEMPGKDYTRDDMIADLNDIITETLRETLNLRNQRILKEAGYMWAMLGVTPKLKGPMGTDIYLGSYEYKPYEQIDPDTGIQRSITFATNEGEVVIPLTKRYSTGSAQSRKLKIIREKDENGLFGWRREERSEKRYGQEVANQLPVLTVQQIDAAIMAKTIFNANRDTFGYRNPHFMIPVHDAIITDASSVKLYHSTINQQFREVNQSYSIAKEVLKGIDSAYDKKQKELRDNPTATVKMDFDSKYRAVHDQLVRFKKEIDEDKVKTSEEKAEDRKTSGTGRNPKKVLMVTMNTKQRIVALATNMGWKEDGSGYISNKTLGYLLEMFYKEIPLRTLLDDMHTLSMSSRRKLYNKLLKTILYQYN
jgi:hypothetical protein